MTGAQAWIEKAFFVFNVSLILGCISACKSPGHEISFRHPLSFTPETDADFLLSKDSSVVVSVSTPTGFRLMKCRDGSCVAADNGTAADSSKRDSFHPFLFKGRVACLQDIDGKEDFQPTDTALRRLLNKRAVEKIYSFKNGDLLVVKCKNDNNLYLIASLEKPNREAVGVLCTITETLNGVVYDEKRRKVIVSHDDVFEEVYMDGFRKREFDGVLSGEKLNIFLFENYIYFVSDGRTGFFSIYRLDHTDSSKTAELVLREDRDLRMPKVNGQTLYYIEIADNNYLLKSMGLDDHIKKEMTHTGVVYNYDFSYDHQLIYSYSDLNTPRTIRVYRDDAKPAPDISHRKQGTDSITYTLLQHDSLSSKAYYLHAGNLHARNQGAPKGVILFIHPGLHSDFSPRWDALLNALCMTGYDVLAPNYPMSSGSGKAFSERAFSDAVDDLASWTSWLSATYHVPIYYLSYSSGNILMEALLAHASKTIHAAASLFGIPGTGSDTVRISTPTLYILGMNDPLINYRQRIEELDQARLHSPISIKPFEREGHWFRRIDNMNTGLESILELFEKNR